MWAFRYGQDAANFSNRSKDAQENSTTFDTNIVRKRWGKYGFEWKTDQKVETAWVKGKNTKLTFKTLKEVQTMNEQDFKLKELEELKVQQLAKERQEIFELEEKVKKGMD